MSQVLDIFIEEKLKLKNYLDMALKEDYFIPMVITSQTEAKHPSKNLPFGMGKTTLALTISNLLHEGNWDKTFEHLFYYPSKLLRAADPEMVSRGEKKIPCAVWDGVQNTCPAGQGIPTLLRKMAGEISEDRPVLSILIMTAPNMASISSVLRRLVVFELIVFERGKYEVQKVKYRKDWEHPLTDRPRMEYVEGTTNAAFDALPPEVFRRYELWRASQKGPSHKSIVKGLERYESSLYLDVDEKIVLAGEASNAASALARKRWKGGSP